MIIVIVEGGDNTGKTTLIKRLVECYPILVPIKSPGPNDDLARWIMKELVERRHDRLRIYDRFFLSEFIYGPIIRGKICYASMHEELIWGVLKQIKPLVILCTIPIEVARMGFGTREQMDGVYEKLDEILQGYNELPQVLTSYGIPYTRYDYTINGSYEKVRHEVFLHSIARIQSVTSGGDSNQ